MSDLDIAIREEHNIPDYIDTITWCEQNGYDYRTELIGAYIAMK